MNAVTVSTVVIAVLALLGFVGGAFAWFHRRGKQDQSLASSVERHAEATEVLAAQVGGLRDTLKEHSETLVEHHWRLKALEK